MSNKTIYIFASAPQNPSVEYAGTSDGVFKSGDGGSTWAKGIGMDGMSVVALAVNPQNQMTVYAGTSSGVFKSVDGGANWNAINISLTHQNVTTLAIDPHNPATIYAGTASGVFKSTNDGNNWSPINVGLKDLNVSAICIDPQNPWIVYAGTGAGVFKSTDGGASWTDVANTRIHGVSALVIDPQTPTTVYAASEGRIFKLYAAPNTNGPIVSSITPTSAIAGSGGFTVTVIGSGFENNSTVQWNGSSRTTTFVGGTQVTAAITAADIAAAGTFNITVVNPTPGGGTSNAQTFTVSNPAPSVTGLSPASATAGGTAFTLTVTGTNFLGTSTVRWNGSDRTTTFVSGAQLTAAIPASDIATAGTASISVFNPSPGGGTSNSIAFTITQPNNPVPVIASISPTSAVAGGAGFNLTVNGSGFVSGSTVRWDGNNRTTTFVSSTRLTAAITASDITSAGTASITVVNPSAGGGTSNAQSFTIAATNPVPTITSLSPTSAVAGGGGFTLTVNGSNFVLGSTINWNGSARTTTFVSSAQLTAVIPASDIAVAGTATVTVFNPAPGGGVSNAQTSTITANVTPISAVGAAIPLSIASGGKVLLFVTVTPGTNPGSTGIRVIGDLTAIGGSSAQEFFDDGTHGDVTMGDKTFSYQATVSAGTSAGTKTIAIAVSDAQSRSSTTSILLSITPAVFLEIPADMIFPQFADGGGYVSNFLLTNSTDTATTATLSFFDNDGTPVGVNIGGTTSPTHQVQVPARGSAKASTSGLPPICIVGWVAVTTNPKVDLGGYGVFQLYNGTTLSSEASVPGVLPVSKIDFFADEDGGSKTGFALANPGSETANGTLTLLTKDGTEFGISWISLPPGGHTAVYLYQIFGDNAPSGRAEISLTSGYLAATVMRYHTSSIFSTVSAATPGFTPAATTALFSPNGGVRDRLVAEINKAQSMIDIAIYSFSVDAIRDALIAARNRGVAIRIIADTSQANGQGSEVATLQGLGFNLKWMSGLYGLYGGTMHNKFMVIDGKLLFTGSYDWSTDAENSNFENAMFVTGSAVIQKYLAAFEAIWGR